MRDPLPSTLGLDDESQLRRSEADHALGLLTLAARFLRDPQHVLVRPARESEVENVASLRGLVLTRRAMASGQHDIDLPYDLERYTQVMNEAAGEPIAMPVSVVLKNVARGLAGLDGEADKDERLPWRTSAWSFAPAQAVEPDVLPGRTHQMSRWMDTVRMPPVDEIAAGTCVLIELDPFANTLEMLHVYASLVLRKAGRLAVQVLPFSEFFVRNQERFRDAFQHVMKTGDYNNWFRFIADCVIEQAAKYVDLALDLSELPEEFERKIERHGRRDGYSRLLRMLPKFQFINAELVAECCDMTPKRARELLHRAEDDEFVTKVGESRKYKTYEVVDVRDLILRYAGVVRDSDRAAVRGLD